MKIPSAHNGAKIVVLLLLLTILVVVSYMVIREYHIFGYGCVEIIGDGYGMGTDPEPVVIGRYCK